MAVAPRLLNPTKVTVTEIDSPKQRIDPLRRTPVNFIAKQVSYKVDAQVKWNTQIGDFANPIMTGTGPDEREMGYIVCLLNDLKPLGKALKRGDRINVAGQFINLNHSNQLRKNLSSNLNNGFIFISFFIYFNNIYCL